MKKRTVFISLLLSAATLVGCSGSPASVFDKTYWDKNPSTSAVAKVNEKLTYSVAFASGKDDLEYVSSVLTADGLGFTADKDCEYVAELTTENDEYVYTTTLKINGEYVFSGGTKRVSDETVTTVRFKSLGDGFRPIESVKSGTNTLPLSSAPKSEEDFAVGSFESKIVYGDKNATLSFTAEENSAYSYPASLSPVTVKNFAKKNYIDNGLIFLLFRTCTFNSSLNFSFNSIDPVGGSLESMKAQSLSDSSTGAQKRSKIELTSFGGANKTTFTAQGVKFSTEGSYGKTVAYAFYALGANESDKDENNVYRKYPLKIYQPATYNSGYFVFTLKKAQ